MKHELYCLKSQDLQYHNVGEVKSMFYRVRARVRRGEATVGVLVLPADVTALVALGALYLDTGQFLLYVFVLHDQLKVDLEREFSRVSKCLCNMHVHDFNYSSQI